MHNFIRFKEMFSYLKNQTIRQNIPGRVFRSNFCTSTTTSSSLKKDKWRDFYEKFSEDFKDLSNEMERRRYNKRIIIGVGISIMGYATYGLFRNWASREVVLISSKTFDDEQFKNKAITFAKEGIQKLAASEEVQESITTLLEKSVIDLVNKENIQNELSNLISKAIDSKKVKDISQSSVKEIVSDLLNSRENESFRKEVSIYLSKEIQKQLADKENQKQASKFTSQTLRGIFWSGK
ncbi:putative ORFan [Tupanvirus deep ocean]|uniref:ORFan n=2 Tax=Tupanvirus TaxID=2094720 RepID=A0AC62A8W2_9VIRU|nr:putative ORFan [Tupanvirus deep ocean]QKU34058.1 putative ORFan [Tupanvirus deep ocean]